MVLIIFGIDGSIHLFLGQTSLLRWKELLGYKYLNIRCSEAFSKIFESWGKVIVPDECNTNSEQWSFGLIGVLTKKFELINEDLKIKVNGDPIVVHVTEIHVSDQEGLKSRVSDSLSSLNLNLNLQSGLIGNVICTDKPESDLADTVAMVH